VVLQEKVIGGRPWWGFMHALVFWAFLVFLLETTDMFARGFGSPVGILGNSGFRHGYEILVAIFAAAALVGILVLTYRRFVMRPPTLGKKLSGKSGLVAVFISLLMITYLLQVFVLDKSSAVFKVNWWVHVLTILSFLVLIPHSKHMHLVASLFTTFFKDFELAKIHPLDFKADEPEMGAETLLDLPKHSVLGAFTCVECGRCYDHCPARNTGKTLDPKKLMLDLKDAFLTNKEGPTYEDERFAEAIFQCTTCGACTYECPVGIDQVVPILEMRRGAVANSIFPDTMRPLFDGLESTGNPWMYQPADAAAFISENHYPQFEKGRVLYWMGCMARYDANYQQASKDFAKLLNQAGVKWGVLPDETCTGDAARRAGNEFLFQMLAEQNIEMLNEAGVTDIVTTCPHCLRTLEEYKEIGLNRDVSVTHHTEYLNRLMKEGKLDLPASVTEKVAYHDPCYLSRYGDESDTINPRELVKKSGANLLEARRNGRRSFCCGAGGAMLFTEETQGKRINHERVEELLETGMDSVAVACPFCSMMVKDGLTDKGHENVQVRDVASLLVAGLNNGQED
ncbi:MAG TPA: (Fe-S)-binding protein, partial [bacterium]